ncbi:hypothetical protein BDV96DRAFT_649861 [Lophiotrema nucula]|uniref:Uncharacterized protein n=1 Tax=Lophiotrema nucula TaxID=690887 RepID=A0A6A5YYI6_9PLEO|nr:hypothetical protein BDV96DRAFT_649861 [Lophiotrema nucula]
MEKLDVLERASDDRLELIATMKGFSDVLKDMEHLCLQEKVDVKEAKADILRQSESQLQSETEKKAIIKRSLQKQRRLYHDASVQYMSALMEQEETSEGIRDIMIDVANQDISKMEERMERLKDLEETLSKKLTKGGREKLRSWIKGEMGIGEKQITKLRKRLAACPALHQDNVRLITNKLWKVEKQKRERDVKFAEFEKAMGI